MRDGNLRTMTSEKSKQFSGELKLVRKHTRHINGITPVWSKPPWGLCPSDGIIRIHT